MAYSPVEEYNILTNSLRLKDLHDYSDYYVTRPPYQRKSVWGKRKKQSLMDSILRKYYVPRLVLRKVRLTDEKIVSEVIDGQQRITTIQDFFSNKFSLPKSLKSLNSEFSGKYYKDLPPEKRQYIDTLVLQSDLIIDIDTKDDPDHQEIATEIFWRLQQGESLNPIEVAHARLASRVRNFLVKYADDITFDYERYIPVDKNPSKHEFFKIIDRGNKRMEHLAMLARMLLIEKSKDYPDMKDKSIQELIDTTVVPNGINDNSYEKEADAKVVRKNLKIFYNLFKNDPILKGGGKVKELSREYFILSIYTLVRHLNTYYVIDENIEESARLFCYEFHRRWRQNDPDDIDIARFRENRQQGATDLRERDIILRHNFFKFLSETKVKIKTKDSRRSFNESERIEIYRKHKGICKSCIKDGKNEKEAHIAWSNFQADHIVAWINGGKTNMKNSQLLCSFHNRSKGST